MTTEDANGDDVPVGDDVPSGDEAPAESPLAQTAESGGDPRIAEALQRLNDLGDRPVEEHVDAYEDVHRVLAETLSDAQQDRPDDRRT